MIAANAFRNSTLETDQLVVDVHPMASVLPVGCLDVLSFKRRRNPLLRALVRSDHCQIWSRDCRPPITDRALEHAIRITPSRPDRPRTSHASGLIVRDASPSSGCAHCYGQPARIEGTGRSGHQSREDRRKGSRMAAVQIEDQVVTDDGSKPGAAGMWPADTRDCHVVVAPPHRTDGVAMMLVALGDAGIGICHVEPRIDDSGVFRLTINDSPDLAVRILEGIGCRVLIDEGD